MSPKKVVRQFINHFNNADPEALTELYHEDAVNHQVADKPVKGKKAIRQQFEKEFASAEMECIVENLFEDGEWAILEWKDPLGLRGCGFFHVVNGKIKFQRGYWDKLSFLRIHEENADSEVNNYVEKQVDCFDHSNPRQISNFKNETFEFDILFESGRRFLDTIFSFQD